MEPATIIQSCIGIILALCLFVLTDIRSEIKGIRERLHKIESRDAAFATHIEFTTRWMDNTKDLPERVLKLEFGRRTAKT